jgi:hypothetical protein
MFRSLSATNHLDPHTSHEGNTSRFKAIKGEHDRRYVTCSKIFRKNSPFHMRLFCQEVNLSGVQIRPSNSEHLRNSPLHNLSRPTTPPLFLHQLPHPTLLSQRLNKCSTGLLKHLDLSSCIITDSEH